MIEESATSDTLDHCRVRLCEGLLFDRQWALFDPSAGALLSLRRHPLLGLIRPRITIGNSPGVPRFPFASDGGGSSCAAELTLTVSGRPELGALVVPIGACSGPTVTDEASGVRDVQSSVERRDQSGEERELRAVGGEEAAAWLQVL